MHLIDMLALDGVRKTKDGFLVADARVARMGIQIYAGREVGKPDMARVRVYRPENEVFAADAMASAAWRTITNDHPTGMVDATNWKALSIGITGDGVARDGDFIRVPLTLMDAAAISAVEGGKRELSLGYTCDLQFEDGLTPDGQAYDAIQKNIRINHLAVVGAGRAGPKCRIGDDALNPEGGLTVPLKTIIFDGLAVETTDAGEMAINKLKGLLETAGKALTDANTAHATALKTATDAHAVEMGRKDAKIAELEGKVVTDAALDAKVVERTAVVARAKAIAKDVAIDGKTNAEIKRAAVAARLGDEKVKDKPDAYVDGLFDNISLGAGAGDPLADALLDGKGGEPDKVVKDARAAMIDEMVNGPAKKAA